MFDYCPVLRPFRSEIEESLQRFESYKKKIPVCGGIVLNARLDKAIFIQPMGSTSWTFPKGKINKDESPFACAIREVP